MSKILTVLAIIGLLSTVGFSQTTTTTTCDPTTCKATTTGTVKQQCCDSTGKCATDSSKCNTCGGVGIYCAGIKNPSGTCDAAKCQYGCCKSDGTCGAQSDCASGSTVCTGTGCSTCCNANKICVFANQTSTCKYCTNDFLVCPAVAPNGDPQSGTCSSKLCQYGCCAGNVCGTQAQCSPTSCDVDSCNKTNGYRCCMKTKACASAQGECYYCENSLICAGIDLSPQTCDPNQCQYKCCDGSKCGAQSVCASSKTWIWWLVGGVVGGLLLLTLLICYIRARRRRLLLAGYQNSSSQYGYNPPPAQYSQQPYSQQYRQ